MGMKVENTSSAHVDAYGAAACGSVDAQQADALKDVEVCAPRLAHYLEEYYNVAYDRKSLDDLDEQDRDIVGNMFKNVTACSEMECFHTVEDMERASEIYAISFYDGRVHVQGGSGYEDKARAYERLLNASLPYISMWSWHGRSVRESQLLEKLDETLHYYMDYDNEIYKKNNKDSIVNHVDDAFSRWYEDNKPKPFERQA